MSFSLQFSSLRRQNIIPLKRAVSLLKSGLQCDKHEVTPSEKCAAVRNLLKQSLSKGDASRQ